MIGGNTIRRGFNAPDDEIFTAFRRPTKKFKVGKVEKIGVFKSPVIGTRHIPNQRWHNSAP
jgi:hypothetical protein